VLVGQKLKAALLVISLTPSAHKFHENLSTTFLVILLVNRENKKPTKKHNLVPQAYIKDGR